MAQKKGFEMLKTSQWIELLRKEKGFDTANEVAAFLDESRQNVSNWANGKTEMDNMTAFKLALAINVNPLFIICCTSYWKASDQKRKKWEILASHITPKHPDERRKVAHAKPKKKGESEEN